MECQKEKNKKNCPCQFFSCPRRRICCKCIKINQKENSQPACL